MATIGHALVGLSLSELCPQRARTGALKYVWTGLIVFLAFVVDLVEWVATFFLPRDSDKHFLSNSAWLGGLVCFVACIAAAVMTRSRHIMIYLIVAAAIFSHLPLDSSRGREFLAESYGISDDLRLLTAWQAAEAECWLYGLLLCEVSLLLAMIDRRCPSKARLLAIFLAILSAAAAYTREIYLWAPAYLLALLHVALLWQAAFDRRMLWGLLFLVPLLVVPVSQILARLYTDQAVKLREAKDYRGALALHERVLSMPTRASFASNYLEMSRCYDAMGEPARSEAALLEMRRGSHEYGPHIPNFWLARFYMNRRWIGTNYYRPQMAAQLLRGIVRESKRSDQQTWASESLDQLRKRMEIDALSALMFSVR